MKRTYTANIDGQIFNIDEDAYTLLQNYLQQLRLTFTGTEGEEIVGDIESRIREHFAELRPNGAVVIINDVNSVIETMGRPEEIGNGDNPSNAAADAHAGSHESLSDTITRVFNIPSHKRLYRNMQNKVFGGVIGGLGAFLGWNANIMRVLLIVLALCTYLWPCVLVYLIAWMIIPAAVTPRQILEMNGEPVNVDTVGQTVIASTPVLGDNSPDVPMPDDGNFFTSFFSISAKLIMAFLGVVFGVLGFGLLVTFLVVVAGIIALTAFNSPTILSQMNFMGFSLVGPFMVLTWLMLGVLISAAIIWAACSVLFHAKGASKSLKITAFIVAMILITIGVVLSLIFAASF